VLQELGIGLELLRPRLVEVDQSVLGHVPGGALEGGGERLERQRADGPANGLGGDPRGRIPVRRGGRRRRVGNCRRRPVVHPGRRYVREVQALRRPSPGRNQRSGLTDPRHATERLLDLLRRAGVRDRNLVEASTVDAALLVPG
jgi:hypothetical protein